MSRVLNEVRVKLLKVIDSMEKVEHIEGVRKYIDLYYQQYGNQHAELIEIYFRTRKEKFI